MQIQHRGGRVADTQVVTFELRFADLVECHFSGQQGENRGVIEHLAQVTDQLLFVEAVTLDRTAGHRLDDFCLNAHVSSVLIVLLFTTV